MNTQIIYFSEEDCRDLQLAKSLLESESLAIKISNMMGDGIEKAMKSLPKFSTDIIESASEKALCAALSVATKTMQNQEKEASRLLHKFAGAVTGAVGGAGGLAALSIELPITATLIMRSILDVARGEGHNIEDPMIQLSALEVFAFGSDKTDEDDGINTGYFAVRASLRSMVKEAAESIGVKGGSSIVTKLIAQISSRFGIAVSEKAMAQILPVLGGIAGAGINTIFIDHYQKLAHGHFIIKRLESKYGRLEVEERYSAL